MGRCSRCRSPARRARLPVRPRCARRRGGRPPRAVRPRRLDVRVVHLHASNPHIAALRLDAQHVAAADCPDQSVPVATVPIPRSVKTRSTSSRVGASSRWVCTAAHASAARSSSDPAPVIALRRRLDCRRSFVRLCRCELKGLGVDGVGLRDHDDAALAPSRRRIARCSCVSRRAPPPRGSRAGRDRCQWRRRPWCERNAHDRARRRARGGVHRGARAARSRGRSRFRGPAPPAGDRVLACQRPDEPRLAVVDVTGGPNGQRHRRSPPRPRRLVVGQRAAVEQRAPIANGAISRRSQVHSFATSSSATAQAKLGSSVRGTRRRLPERRSPRLRRRRARPAGHPRAHGLR